VEADGSQTIPEFWKEYTHIVSDLKPWPYFDIPGCLKRLSWSDDECSGHITHQWLDKSLYTRHAVVQLALYTCPPFRDIPPAGYPRSSTTEGYIIDESNFKNGDKKLRKYFCRSVRSLVEALATALMHYESWCKQYNWWPHFQRQRDESIQFLENFQQQLNRLRRRTVTPKSRVLKNNRWLEQNIPKVIQGLQAFTYDDYQQTHAPTNEPRDPRAHWRKYHLLNEMKEAFNTYKPDKWREEMTYRALAAIANQMKITNAKGKEWLPGSIKRFLAWGPDSHITFTVHLTQPEVVPWYTRPE
jgi:hypothetical protein